MTEKKLDEMIFILKGLSEDNKKILELLKPASQETVKKEIEITNTVQEEIINPQAISNFALPKTGKYQWYKLKDSVPTIKLRKCMNEGCLLFLKWNDDKKKYEHWKFDANTGVGGYVQDNCEFYGG